MAAIAGDRLSLFRLWHSRLGHLSVTCLRQLIYSGSLGNVTFKTYLIVSVVVFPNLSLYPFIEALLTLHMLLI